MAKFCKFCGQEVSEEAVICIHCGRQIEELKSAQQQPQVVINNSNNNSNINNVSSICGKGRVKNKWIAIVLLLLGGCFGAHKFYEGKILMGIIYFLTVGFVSIGCIIDLIILLFKPTNYIV